MPAQLTSTCPTCFSEREPGCSTRVECPLPRSVFHWEQSTIGTSMVGLSLEPRSSASTGLRTSHMAAEAGTAMLSSEKLFPAIRPGRARRPPVRPCGDTAQCGDAPHGSSDDRYRIPVPALRRRMSLDMLTNLSEPQSPHLQSGNKNSPFPRGLL